MTAIHDAHDAAVIRFVAAVYKVQTLVDGGLRVTLDMPESSIDAMSALVTVRRAGALLEVAAVPVKQESNRDGKVSTRSKWQY